MFELGYQVDLIRANSFGLSSSQRQLICTLPAYPMDRSKTFWQESCSSRGYGLRQNRPHELLGVRIPSNTSLEPNGRRIVGVETLLGLEEHVIDGLAVSHINAWLRIA
ncbi:hypothetical protein BDR22DRAFT_580108 [Usnea florida]